MTGDELFDWRTRRVDLTRVDLAAHLGAEPATVAQWEGGAKLPEMVASSVDVLSMRLAVARQDAEALTDSALRLLAECTTAVRRRPRK